MCVCVCVQAGLVLLEEWLLGRTRGKREEFVNYERGISVWMGEIVLCVCVCAESQGMW